MNDCTNTSNAIDPGQEWEVDLFRPEDACGVRQLFLSVYGEGYPIRTYLEPERLIAENAAGTIISSVARTTRGDIVGHNALYNSAPYKGIYESGAGLVHMDYRGGKGIFTMLVSHGIEIGAKRFPVEAVFGEAVCNHIISQKLTHKTGAITHAIEVDLMPASAYTKEKSAPGRVASLLDFITILQKPHRVYIPSVYEEEIRYIYAGLDDTREISVSIDEINKDAVTRMEVRYFDFAQVSRTAVSSTGMDFEEAFLRQEKKLLDQGATVLQVSQSLSKPWAGMPVEFLRKRGYFFCGILPRWLDADAILMTKIVHRPFWEDMQIQFERAKRILEMVRADWERTVKER